MKFLIAISNFNRRKIASKCIYSVWNTKQKDDRLVVYDDFSQDYNPEDFFKDRCDELAVCTQNIGINEQRHNHVMDFLNQYQKYDMLYLTDSDAYHDEHWRSYLEALWEETKLPCCLFNSKCHEQNTIENKGLYVIRKYAAGISLLLSRDMCVKIIDNLDKIRESQWCWDMAYLDVLGNRCATSNISLIEHFGAGGMHSDDFERDRAVNPTPFLKDKRETLLRKFK